MAAEKILDQLKAVKTAWPIFVFIGTIILNNLNSQNNLKDELKTVRYEFSISIAELKNVDKSHNDKDDWLNYRIDDIKQDLVRNYKRKPNVD